jgi:hypothetical protein
MPLFCENPDKPMLVTGPTSGCFYEPSQSDNGCRCRERRSNNSTEPMPNVPLNLSNLAKTTDR